MSETREYLSETEEQSQDNIQEELNYIQTTSPVEGNGNVSASDGESDHDSLTDDARDTTSRDIVAESVSQEQEAIDTRRSSSLQQPATVGGTLTRVSLGSALLAIDTLNERLEGVAEAEEAEAANRTIDAVLVPMSEWEERFGESPGTAARHVAIGMMIDARSSANRGIRLINNIGNSAIKALEIVVGPVVNSKPFRPVLRRFDLAVSRGESQVSYWMNLGRAEDTRSRALAERTISNAADYSMDEIVKNERIQVFVQEMMAAQSLGIIDEAIEEVRERTVSSDTFFERPFRRLFRRPHRDDIPAPEIDPVIVRPISRSIQSRHEVSLLGYYAGFTSRLMALALDAAIIMIFAALTGWMFQTLGQLLAASQSIEALSLAESIVEALGALFSGLNLLTVVIVYGFIFWTLTGQTPGMMLFGLRVVTDDGGHLTSWRSFLRLLGFVISIIFFFIGFLWVLFDDRRQGWHDKLAGTFVIYSWDAHPDETFLTYRDHMKN